MIFPPGRMMRALLWPALIGLAARPLVAQVTEVPQTMAPGKLLIRMDAVTLSSGRAEAVGNKYTAVGVASTIVSTGLTPVLDLQVGFDLFLRETFVFKGTRTSHSGLGDLSFRTKWTFWRDEKSGTAVAVIPYVKIPSSTGGVGSKSVEGGFIVPWATGAGAGVTAGAMLQWDMVRNDADNGYDAHWLVSGYMRRDLAAGFAVYGEAKLEAASTGLSDWAGMIGVGALWNVSKRIRLDYELLRGLNRRASDWTNILRLNWEW